MWSGAAALRFIFSLIPAQPILPISSTLWHWLEWRLDLNSDWFSKISVLTTSILCILFFVFPLCYISSFSTYRSMIHRLPVSAVSLPKPYVLSGEYQYHLQSHFTSTLWASFTFQLCVLVCRVGGVPKTYLCPGKRLWDREIFAGGCATFMSLSALCSTAMLSQWAPLSFTEEQSRWQPGRGNNSILYFKASSYAR